MNKQTATETFLAVMYWIGFFAIIGMGDLGIYIGVSSLNLYETPAIFGFMAAYSVGMVLILCCATGAVAYCCCRDPDPLCLSDLDNHFSVNVL